MKDLPDADDATAQLTAALHIQQRIFKEKHPDIARTHGYLGVSRYAAVV